MNSWYSLMMSMSLVPPLPNCESLDRVLTLIEEVGLKVKPEKCLILPRSVPFFGDILSRKECPRTSKRFLQWQPLTKVSEVRVLLAEIGYYRTFTPDFATLAAPLFKLEEKGRKFVWSIGCQKSFDTLKQPYVKHPCSHFQDLTFHLY